MTMSHADGEFYIVQTVDNGQWVDHSDHGELAQAEAVCETLNRYRVLKTQPVIIGAKLKEKATA